MDVPVRLARKLADACSLKWEFEPVIGTAVLEGNAERAAQVNPYTTLNDRKRRDEYTKERIAEINKAKRTPPRRF